MQFSRLAAPATAHCQLRMQATHKIAPSSRLRRHEESIAAQIAIMRAVPLSLLVVALLLHHSSAVSFSGHRNYAHNLLGSSDLSNLNLKTGFFDFSETRLNIHGERSSAFYHIKPHATKLKVKVDSQCFAVKCSPGKVVLTEKILQSANQHDSHGNDCLHSSVFALTTSPDFTGRTLAFNPKRPSLSDLHTGDLLHGDIKCHDSTSLASESFTITSIFQQSDTSFGSSKRIYELNIKPATVADIVSEGEFEFHTENLLTVNDVEQPHVLEQRMTSRALSWVRVEAQNEFRNRLDLLVILARSVFAAVSSHFFFSRHLFSARARHSS